MNSNNKEGGVWNKAVVNLKKEYEWLNEVSSVALQQSAMQLATAFNNFFKNPNVYKHPKFKISVDLFLLNVLEKDNKRGIIERLIKINKGNKVYLNPSKKPIL